MHKIKNLFKKINEIINYCRKIGISPLLFFFTAVVRKIGNRFYRKTVCQDIDGNALQYRHAFIHSLVLEPEKAFSPYNDSQHNFDSWFITKDEFTAFLNECYNNGYILVRPRDLFCGKLKLPAGKNPLILSFDDMNYYEYMSNYGFPEKVGIDSENKLLYTITRNNKKEYIYEGDSIGVLEKFISEHPDFSYNNSRGIIALTGYEGALGYRDISDPELKKTVKAIKDMGYEFASHSWGHHHKIYNNECPHGPKGIKDIKKWLGGVGKVVGKTDTLITPFGADIKLNPILLHYLKNKGFKYFFFVSDDDEVIKSGKFFFAGRSNIDGISLRLKPDLIKQKFADPEKIYSNKRFYPLVYDFSSDSFVKFAKHCLEIPTIYLWDGMGEYLTCSVVNIKKKLYPDFYTEKEWEVFINSEDGKTRIFDCSGLIKRFYMGGFSHYRYQPEKDFYSAKLLENSSDSGDIDSMPELEGVCLYMEGHVGIYIGSGEVIESTPNKKFGNGVVKTKLSDRSWEKWFLCPFVDYGKADI